MAAALPPPLAAAALAFPAGRVRQEPLTRMVEEVEANRRAAREEGIRGEERARVLAMAPQQLAEYLGAAGDEAGRVGVTTQDRALAVAVAAGLTGLQGES